MIATVRGVRARFCGLLCVQGFAADRAAKLVYSSTRVDGTHVSVEEASLKFDRCAYCDNRVGDRPKKPTTKESL